MFFKEFEIRWSDLDANWHLADAAYINFGSHTRMAYLAEAGFGQKALALHTLGPVAFYEHMYFFKEVFPGKPIKVSLQFEGMSEDGQFFEFHHNFYDSYGKNIARCEMMGGWIDLTQRKLTPLPPPLLEALKKLPKSPTFKVLTKADTRKFGRTPMDLI